MQLTRFRELAEAYGGDIQRWPSETHGPARLLLQSDPAAARALALAAEDDLRLDAFAPPRATAALRDALIAAAPKARSGLRLGIDWRGLFLPGAGLAAGLAGALVGAVLYSHVVDAAQTDALVDSALVDNTAVDNGVIEDLGPSLTVSVIAPAGLA
jgi:hypothetical protein